jgi:hypothetical protein
VQYGDQGSMLVAALLLYLPGLSTCSTGIKALCDSSRDASICSIRVSKAVKKLLAYLSKAATSIPGLFQRCFDMLNPGLLVAALLLYFFIASIGRIWCFEMLGCGECRRGVDLLPILAVKK